MSCPRRFELTRYHAEDLAVSEAEVVQGHLVECTRCVHARTDVVGSFSRPRRCPGEGREVLGELERLRREFLRRHPPDQVVPEILAEAERRERSWWWRLRVWWWILRGDFSS